MVVGILVRTATRPLQKRLESGDGCWRPAGDDAPPSRIVARPICSPLTTINPLPCLLLLSSALHRPLILTCRIGPLIPLTFAPVHRRRVPQPPLAALDVLNRWHRRCLPSVPRLCCLRSLPTRSPRLDRPETGDLLRDVLWSYHLRRAPRSVCMHRASPAGCRSQYLQALTRVEMNCALHSSLQIRPIGAPSATRSASACRSSRARLGWRDLEASQSHGGVSFLSLNLPPRLSTLSPTSSYLSRRPFRRRLRRLT